ncbi:hypothetical protein QQ045_014264 [Rhodiola kirilowii]
MDDGLIVEQNRLRKHKTSSTENLRMMTDYSPGWVGLKFYPAQEFHETLVSIHCEKCKQDVFKAVTKLTSIDQLSLDGEKGLLTIIGTVDPVHVVERIKEKARKRAYLESVGPVEAPNPTDPEPTPSADSGKEKDPQSQFVLLLCISTATITANSLDLHMVLFRTEEAEDQTAPFSDASSFIHSNTMLRSQLSILLFM